MLETCWWPRLHGSKECCRDRPPTARWMQVWPFRRLQGVHKHWYNFPRDNKSIISSTTLFPGVWELWWKSCFSHRNVTSLATKKSVFSQKCCTGEKMLPHEQSEYPYLSIQPQAWGSHVSEVGGIAPSVSLRRNYLAKWDRTGWEINNKCSVFNIQKEKRTNFKKVRKRLSIYELLEREVMGKG